MRTRWYLVMVALCCLGWLNSSAKTVTPAKADKQTVLVIGDSLSAQYGIKPGSGWVSIMAEKLKVEEPRYVVHNSSVSGDTTSGGVSRLPAALARYTPNIVIIELGSNDALRGLSLKQMQHNLATMIELVQQAKAQVLLVGMQMPPNFGRLYTEQFQEVFADLAKQYKVDLVPFLLEGIATDKDMFQADGIHPNEAGQPAMARNVWARLKPMITP